MNPQIANATESLNETELEVLGNLKTKDETDAVECPLCLGRGHLKRSEMLDRLGMKNLREVAELTAAEAFHLLQQKQKEQEDTLWSRFETELTKRTAELTEKHRKELHALSIEKSAVDVRLNDARANQESALRIATESERLAAEKEFHERLSSLQGRIRDLEALLSVSDEQKAVHLEKTRTELDGRIREEQSKNIDLNRKTQDYLQEISVLRAKLESEMSKSVRIGRKEEMDFGDEARTWPGMWVERLKRHGDYLLAFRDPAGKCVEPRMVVDNKAKDCVTEADVEKLLRDAVEQTTVVGILVAQEETQLRQLDKEARWSSKNGVWILRTTRQWLPRDLEVLKPILDRMRAEGPDFLQKNSALCEEVRRTFVEIDEVEKELKKAAKSIETVSRMVARYKNRLQALCDSVGVGKPITAASSEPGAIAV